MLNSTQTTLVYSRRGNISSVYDKICMKYHKEIELRHCGNRGIWSGHNPLDSLETLFLVQLIFFFIVSRALYFLLRPLKQPRFVCNILAGIVLGPSVLGHNKMFMETFFPVKQSGVFLFAATFGGLSFIFITSVKTDMDLIMKAEKKAWIIGALSFVVPYMGEVLLLYNLKDILPNLRGPFISCICSIFSVTYVPVIIQALDELNILTSELGQLAISSALVNQLIGLILMSLGFASIQDTFTQAASALLSLCALVCLLVFVLRPAILRIIKDKAEDKLVHETYFVTIIVGSLVAGALTDLFGATPVLGVLLAGLIIPDGPPLGSTLIVKFDLITKELFLPFYYARVGLYTDVFSIKDWKVAGILILIIISGHLCKIVATLWVSIFLSIKPRNAFLLSVISNLWGIVQFAALNQMAMRQIMDKQSYSVLVVMNLVLTVISSPIIELFYKSQRLDTSSWRSNFVRTLQSTPHDGEIRVLACVHSEQNVSGLLKLLEASIMNAVSPLCIYAIHLIQFVGREVPLLVPYEKNKRNNLSSSNHIMSAFANYTQNSCGSVTFKPYTLVAPYKTMDGSVCNLAEDMHIPLIILPLHKDDQSQDEDSSELRKFNAMIQASALCTVGILVDRSSNCKMANFFSNIALLFFGGADDREALALAIRMSGNPNVSVTVIKVNSEMNKTQRTDTQYDDLLINEFKLKNQQNANAFFHEFVINESFVEVMDIVKPLESNCDLVMVGKRKVQYEEEISDWLEHPELGVLGDMLASSDILEGRMSVLVMQQGAKHNVALLDHSMNNFQNEVDKQNLV